MTRLALLVAATLSLASAAWAQGPNELPPEIAARYAQKADLPAGLPTGPSTYRNWKSPRTAPWRFAYVGSTRYGTWSDAALKFAQEKVEPAWEKLGLNRELVAPPAAKDDAEASRQIRALADQGVDAILVCCGAPTGLNDAIKYARDKGTLTVTLFGFSTSPYALNVVNDFAHVGDYLVQRISEDLGEKGNVLIVGGFLGSPASDALDRGVKAGLADFPRLKVVGNLPVQGGSEAARAAVKAWLATHREPVDGVILRAGANKGVLELFAEAGRKSPLITIGGDLASLCYWRHHPDFAGDYYLQKGVVGWPPGDAVSLAFHVAQRTLQGQGPKTQSVLVDPLWLSYYDMMNSLPETCREDDDGWLTVGGQSWGGPRTLDAYFGKPADPKAFKP